MPVNMAYAVPGPEAALTDGWWDATGYATQIRESPTGTPDANRLRHLPLYETREGEGSPEQFADRYRRDVVRRHAVEYQDADGFEEIKERRRMAPRPVPGDVPEPRPTTKMSPHRYVFTRPWDQRMARALNGSHFSMADHRREYPILGMDAPVKIRRNTYRLEPEPWDADLVDMPPDVDPSPNGRIVAVDIPPAGNRSWRL